MFLVMDAPDLRLYSSPVKHFLPSFGLRFEFKAEEKSLAYSCDTEACPAVVKLAQGVDVLIHEASGPFRGHSSASQAGEVARQAEAKALYLIHYPTGRFASGDIVAEARSSFPGTVVKAEDFMQVNFG
jgi:ribonuclease Z